MMGGDITVASEPGKGCRAARTVRASRCGGIAQKACRKWRV
jgi:hypothetical protein